MATATGQKKIQEKVASIFPRLDEIPREYMPMMPLKQREYLIGGKIRYWEGPVQKVLSPVCIETDEGPVQQLVGSYPMLTEKESMEALKAATSAYGNGRGAWPTMSVAQRIAHVETFIHMMSGKREQIVNLIMWEIGKNLADSRKEFDRTIQYVKDTIDALKELDRVSSRFSIEKGIIGQIRRAPLGVVLCMGPYNYPLNETFTTLIPALIMGNTAILKPPKMGVLLHGPLLEAFRDAFPPGVINTVYGDGRTVVGPLMSSGKIDVLAFIGTSPVADILKRQHPTPHRLRSVLGLEAKNPAIILADADLDMAADEVLLGSLSFNGQRCTALKMVFVHSKVADTFIEKLKERLARLKIGMPWEEGVKITPLPEEGKAEFLKGMVDDAIALGAKVINEGGGTFNETFYYPAAVYPVAPQAKLYTQEQFGPVIPITTFDDVAEPIRYVEESNYGQQVSIFGSNPDEMADLIDPLVNQVCRVNLNSQCQRGPDAFPFTGRKDSAEGTLSVSDALRVFTIRTLVAAKEKELNKKIVNDIVRNRRSNFLSTDFIL